METLAIGNDGHDAAVAKNAIFFSLTALHIFAHRLLSYFMDIVKNRQE